MSNINHPVRAGRGSRKVSVLVVAAVALSAVTAVSAAAASKHSDSATFEKRVNIGEGRSMYIECRGHGKPTVLLISGSGTASDLWHAADQKGPKVYPTIGKQTRTCAYDRPGAPHLTGELSRSDPMPQPTSSVSGADDLTALVKAAKVTGPYVLVAHSFGGNIARVFAADHPGQVKGIVFLDILTPELRAQMTSEQWSTWTMANARQPKDLKAYPQIERQDFNESLDQVEAVAPLRPMPLVVLTASVKYKGLVPKLIDQGVLPTSVPRDFGTVIDRTNAAAQNELAALVPGAVHITNTKSGHNIMVDNAPVTIRAIEMVLKAVRAGKTSLRR